MHKDELVTNAFYKGEPLDIKPGVEHEMKNKPIWAWACDISLTNTSCPWPTYECMPMEGMIVDFSTPTGRPVVHFKEFKKGSRTEVKTNPKTKYKSRNYSDTYEEAVKEFNAMLDFIMVERDKALEKEIEWLISKGKQDKIEDARYWHNKYQQGILDRKIVL